MKIKDMKTLELYTDGSCQVATEKKNGTCAYVVIDGQTVVHKQGYKYEDTTNNRMELMGCIWALRWVKEQDNVGRVYIHMDSQYVQLGLTEWLEGWKRKNWKTSTKKPVVNVDLWMELDALKSKLPMVQFQWVRGHNNNKFNEMADELCRQSYMQVNQETLKRAKYQESAKNAKEFLLSKWLPTSTNEQRELWYKCSPWAPKVVEIMEEYNSII